MLPVVFTLAGCIPPTVYGLRFDGSMAENSELALTGGYYPDQASSGNSPADASVLGLQGRQRLGNNVTAALTAGAAPGTLEDSLFGNAELDIQGRLLDEKPLTLAVSGGLSAIGTPDGAQLNLLAGFQFGVVASRHLGSDFRPFVAAKINPVFGGGSAIYPWLTAGGGLTWRPVVAPGTRALFAAEVFGLHGFGADLENATDITTWGVGLQAGASFGNENW